MYQLLCRGDIPSRAVLFTRVLLNHLEYGTCRLIDRSRGQEESIEITGYMLVPRGHDGHRRNSFAESKGIESAPATCVRVISHVLLLAVGFTSPCSSNF